jgi:predicted HTH transcriptional regulator
MKCARCETSIPEGEEQEHLGRMLCEDCYMDALSPAKTCDPWAVHSAKSFGKNLGGKFDLTELQQKILEILQETGGAPSEHLVERLNISPMDLEREIAALRHMEKVRGELRSGKKYIRLW